MSLKTISVGAVVVAHLVERSLLTPEVRGLNPVIGKLLLFGYLFVYCQLYRKAEDKDDEAKEWPRITTVYFCLVDSLNVSQGSYRS